MSWPTVFGSNNTMATVALGTPPYTVEARCLSKGKQLDVDRRVSSAGRRLSRGKSAHASHSIEY